MKKRFVTLVLALSLVLSLCSFGVVYADDFNKEYLTEMNFLKVLSLIEEDYDSTLVITKAEIADMILGTLYSEIDFSAMIPKGQAFKDVPVDHPYYSVITAAKDLGIVNGDGSSNFNPDKQINLSEGIAMLVNALGYTHHATQFGGFPSGYYQIAREIGMLKNVNLALTDTVNGGDAVRLLYNSLFANTVEAVSYGTDGISLRVNPDSTILNERFSVYEYVATVIDDGITAIEGESINDIERAVIRVNRTGEIIKAYAKDCDLKAYLGMRVKVFVRNNKEEGRYEFLYAVPYDDSAVTLNRKNIISFNDTLIEYDEDINTAKTEKIKLSSERPVIIFNGIRIVDKTLTELIPNDGFVKLIDNNGDSNYDVVIIYSFNYKDNVYNAPARNIIVDSVILDEDEEGISCSFNPMASIDLYEDDYIYSFVLSDNIKSLRDISKDMVVSVAEAPEKINGKTYYQLAVSDSLKEGILDFTEGDKSVYLSDTEYYDLSTSLTSIKGSVINTLKIGKSLKLWLDITGKAAYVETDEGGTKNYAYIVKAVGKNQGDEYVLVKFFTKDGKMLSLPLSEKAYVDGISMSGKSITDQLSAINDRPEAASSVAGAKLTGRPAIVTVSGDKIIKIDTDTPNENLSGGEISETYIQQSAIQYSRDDADSYDTLKAGFRSPRALPVRGTTKMVGSKFFITSNTVILSVPEIDTYGLNKLSDYRPFGHTTVYYGSNSYPLDLDMLENYINENDDENYKVLSPSNLASSYSMDVQGYDIDPDTGVAGLVVVRGRMDMLRSGNVPTATPMSVFLKTSEVYDTALEKTVTKVYYYENGDEKSATIDLDTCFYPYKALIKGCAAGDTPHNTAVTALKNGDVIRVIQSGGKITHIERVLRLKDIMADYTAAVTTFSKMVTVPYSNSVEGSKSTFPYDMPVIDKEDREYNSVESSNVVAMLYPVALKGNTIQIATAKEYDKSFESIDLTNYSSYSKLYYNTNQMVITVIDIPSDGGDIEIKNGTVNDIVTYEDAGKDIASTSIMVTKVVSHELTETFIINGYSNIK